MPEIRMMATTGMLGYGYTEEAFQRGLEQNLDFIAADSGSMDPGPHYLGEGVPFVSRQALKRDLSLMLEAAVDKKIPMLIGSAGGGGSEPQLALVREVVEEIATEKNLHFDMALIHSEQSAEYLKAKLADGKIESLGPIAELTDDEIDQSERVVAMMGVEPFQAALKGGAQVVLAGRATDASIYSAIPLMRGAHAGLSWHLSKIIECAGQVTTPRPGQDCVIGTLRDDHFLVEPGHPDKRCTRMRIAAHTLYENPSPYRLEEPDGTLVTINSVYEQLDERIVKVSGSQFEPSAAYTVKLEGVKESGYRTVFIAGVRDPILISVIDDFIASRWKLRIWASPRTPTGSTSAFTGRTRPWARANPCRISTAMKSAFWSMSWPATQTPAKPSWPRRAMHCCTRTFQAANAFPETWRSRFRHPICPSA